MTHELPKLNYEYNALEPYIEEQTMRIHHTKHHQGYTDKLNKAVEGTEFANKDPLELLRNIESLPETIRTAVRNNGGGFVNHSFFWKSLSPKGGFPKGPLADAINGKWGSFEKFKEEFSNTAAALFGSGWVWLAKDGEELAIVTTSNQDSPVSEGKNPLFCLDVWEPAYYLKYQNKRQEYIEAFWNVVNWEEAGRNFEK